MSRKISIPANITERQDYITPVARKVVETFFVQSYPKSNAYREFMGVLDSDFNALDLFKMAQDEPLVGSLGLDRAGLSELQVVGHYIATLDAAANMMVNLSKMINSAGKDAKYTTWHNLHKYVQLPGFVSPRFANEPRKVNGKSLAAWMTVDAKYDAIKAIAEMELHSYPIPNLALGLAQGNSMVFIGNDGKFNPVKDLNLVGWNVLNGGSVLDISTAVHGHVAAVQGLMRNATDEQKAVIQEISDIATQALPWAEKTGPVLALSLNADGNAIVRGNFNPARGSFQARLAEAARVARVQEVLLNQYQKLMQQFAAAWDGNLMIRDGPGIQNYLRRSGPLKSCGRGSRIVYVNPATLQEYSHAPVVRKINGQEYYYDGEGEGLNAICKPAIGVDASDVYVNGDIAAALGNMRLRSKTRSHSRGRDAQGRFLPGHHSTYMSHWRAVMTRSQSKAKKAAAVTPKKKNGGATKKRSKTPAPRARSQSRKPKKRTDYVKAGWVPASKSHSIAAKKRKRNKKGQFAPEGKKRSKTPAPRARSQSRKPAGRPIPGKKRLRSMSSGVRPKSRSKPWRVSSGHAPPITSRMKLKNVQLRARAWYYATHKGNTSVAGLKNAVHEASTKLARVKRMAKMKQKKKAKSKKVKKEPTIAQMYGAAKKKAKAKKKKAWPKKKNTAKAPSIIADVIGDNDDTESDSDYVQGSDSDGEAEYVPLTPRRSSSRALVPRSSGQAYYVEEPPDATEMGHSIAGLRRSIRSMRSRSQKYMPAWLKKALSS